MNIDLLKKDILNYLSNYIDIKEISKRYNEAVYISVEKRVSEIKFENIHEFKIELENGAGNTFTTLPIEKDKFIILPTICIVRNADKNVLFHELMHVGSISQVKNNNGDVIYKSGINKRIHRIEKEDIYNFYPYLNEVLTECVAKMIYDDIYEDKYSIVKIENEMIITNSYQRGYFLFSYLLLNYFEEHKKELFDIYFNNNVLLLEKIIEENTEYNIKTLDDKMKKLQEKENSLFIELNYKFLLRKLNKKNKLRNKDVIYQSKL